ncbi:histidine kinase [Sphingomonas naphthae]|uniref:Histidine kinase n=1 Tax=Sphingomonas naphthae TaxID=1813468 RepID=A0ABY7TGI8_9SPHN|nr:histidine kinase [Sphingomonas naphthae]WCT72259.1 histidine kinase [Sphingomonas naphthae]
MTGTPRSRDTVAMRTAGERWWEGPWPWLGYLVFLPLPWLWMPPGTATLLWTGLALAAFLPLYFLAHRLEGIRRAAVCVAITAIGIALAPLPVNWTTFAIYGAAEMGRVRPPRIAVAGIAAIATVTAIVGLWFGQPVFWWLPGVVLIVMTGGGTISREAFYRRTQALLATQEEVRRLAGIAERERIARDLHDVVGRTLTLVALKADLAGRMLDRDIGAARSEVDAIGAAARAGLAEVRAALAGQSGGGLTQEASASIHALRTAGVEPVLTGDPGDIPADAGAVLAMTLREAVTNVIRHAGARRCAIAIAAGPGAARLVVEDDGIGLSFREGNGLTGMRQRLVAAGGSLRLSAGLPGIRLEASVPT